MSRVSGRVGPNSAAPVSCGNRRGFVVQRRVMAPLRSASQTATTVESVTELMSMGDFDSVMESAGDQLVVLDIGSTKCGPCKMVWPKYVELSEEFGEQAVFLKINGDTNKDTVAMMKAWEVKAVPEFRFYKNGEVIHKHTGADAAKLRGHIEEFL